MGEAKQYKGSCHCGNIRFTLDWLPDPLEIPARACGCSFCVKHGGVRTSYPYGALRVRIAEVSRSLVRQLGVNLASIDRTGGFQFGWGHYVADVKQHFSMLVEPSRGGSGWRCHWRGHRRVCRESAARSTCAVWPE